MLGLAPADLTAESRGFRAPVEPARARLEEVAASFASGFNLALELPYRALGPALRTVELERRGWAYEGATLGLALFDLLRPFGRPRWRGLLDGEGDGYTYLVHVGLGWAHARLRRRISGPPGDTDPLLGWLAVDGYGFHDGFFRSRQTLVAKKRPSRVGRTTHRVYDQGIGRSLWFVEGADVSRLESVVRTFSGDRRADLWSGVGLAAGYAGGIHEAELERLVHAAAEHRPALAQGVAFAAKARARARNPSELTERACLVVCGSDATEAAARTDEVLAALPTPHDAATYSEWLHGLRRVYAARA